MCWPEAKLGPVQGVAGLENALPAGPSGPRSAGDCHVRPKQWAPKGFWLTQPQPGVLVQPPSPHMACSQLPSLKVLRGQTQPELPLLSVSQWETIGAAGCSPVPSC